MEQNEIKKETLDKSPDPEKIYLENITKFSSFYLGLVLLTVAGVLGGIYVAVMEELSWGAVIFGVSIFFYVRFLSSEMYDKLGISYKTDAGSLTVTSCRVRYGKRVYIPKRLIWYDVEAIDDYAFDTKKSAEICEVYLPSSLKKIGKDIFHSCENLEAVYFEGTEEEWCAIESGTDIGDVALFFNSVYPKKEKAEK